MPAMRFCFPLDLCQARYLLRERKSGSFMRTIALPNSDPEKAVAKFKDGVLELVVPKQEADKRQGRQLLIEE